MKVMPSDRRVEAVLRPEGSSLAAATQATTDGVALALEVWRTRLTQAGVAARDIALHGPQEAWSRPFASSDDAMRAAWLDLRTQCSVSSPVLMRRLVESAASDMLVACRLVLNVDLQVVVGVLLAPPQGERAVQTLLLALGSLQQSLTVADSSGVRFAATLLELLGHVSSQPAARDAAVEWVNRTAAWLRAQINSETDAVSLALFEVRGHQPRWWVSSDVAWVETESDAMRSQRELAAQAVLEMRELAHGPLLGIPILSGGDVVAVAVLKLEGDPLVLKPRVLPLLRASVGLAEPLLRHWRQADRSLVRHLLDSCIEGWRRVWSPGHRVWKAGAALMVAITLGLTLVPITDRVTASTVIEGEVRHVVSTPFDGFIAQALVRPGERVVAGQELARLDDRDLRLEQAKFRSERDQAAGKVRVAMAERDAAQLALASAEVRQADAQLSLVDAKLMRTVLVAPASGLVVSGDWVQHIGGPVETGKEMFEIASTAGYRVVLHVADRDIARVRPGQVGHLRLTGQPHTTFEFDVKVVTATASVQEGSNGFRVEAAWRGEPPALSPGMQGIAKVDTGRASLIEIWTRSTLDWLRLKLWVWGWW